MTNRTTAEGWVRPTEDTIAPDPTSQRFNEAAWTLRYGLFPDLYVASVVDSYATLVTHPEGEAILRRIRKAMKENP